MKKSNENIKKEISSITSNHQETNQPMDTTNRTSAEETIPANTRNKFFGLFSRLVCSPNANQLSDESEKVFIPKK